MAVDSLYVESGYVDAGYFGTQRNATATWAIGSYTEPDYVATDYFEDYGTRGSFATLTVTVGQVEGTATLASTLSLSASAQIQLYATSTLDSTTSQSATAQRQRPGSSSLSASATLGASALRQRNSSSSLSASTTQTGVAQAQRNASTTLNTSATQQVQGSFKTVASATLDAANAFVAIGARADSITESNNKSWEYEDRTWQTYWGQVWGRPIFTLAAESAITIQGNRSTGSATATLSGATTQVVVGDVGSTKTATTTVSVVSTQSTAVERIRTLSSSLSVTATSTSEAVVARSITQGLTSTSAMQSAAIIQVSASASLQVETTLRVLTAGEALLFSIAELQATADRIRTFSATLEGVNAILVTPNVGQTEYMPATTISGVFTAGFKGNYITRNNPASFAGVSATIGIGTIITLDPFRNIDVDQESRNMILPLETTIYQVLAENRVNTTTQENREFLVPQETRVDNIPMAPYIKRRQLA